jgi:hypothetical protein
VTCSTTSFLASCFDSTFPTDIPNRSIMFFCTRMLPFSRSSMEENSLFTSATIASGLSAAGLPSWPARLSAACWVPTHRPTIVSNDCLKCKNAASRGSLPSCRYAGLTWGGNRRAGEAGYTCISLHVGRGLRRRVKSNTGQHLRQVSLKNSTPKSRRMAAIPWNGPISRSTVRMTHIHLFRWHPLVLPCAH